MRVIIAGTRTMGDATLIDQAAVNSGFAISKVVTGGCRGIDKLAEAWARRKGIPVEVVKPDWEAHGRAGGPIRNKAMALKAQALIAIWDGKSRGTMSMIAIARAAGLSVYIEMVGGLYASRSL